MHWQIIVRYTILECLTLTVVRHDYFQCLDDRLCGSTSLAGKFGAFLFPCIHMSKQYHVSPYSNLNITALVLTIGHGVEAIRQACVSCRFMVCSECRWNFETSVYSCCIYTQLYLECCCDRSSFFTIALALIHAHLVDSPVRMHTVMQVQKRRLFLNLFMLLSCNL